MKKITQKKSKKYNPDFGWINQISFFIFGFKFWTENHLIEISEPDEAEEKENIHNLEEMAMYAEWREKLGLMRLNDDDFVQILNSRF